MATKEQCINAVDAIEGLPIQINPNSFIGLCLTFAQQAMSENKYDEAGKILKAIISDLHSAAVH